MSIHLQRDLKALELDLLSQSSIVEQMIHLAGHCLREHTAERFDELQSLETTVNQREVEIEEECLKILALHQPVAVDLRQVTTVMKINGDLERIADLAVNIGERARSLVSHSHSRIPNELDKMAEEAIAMVRGSLDAFVRLDVESARHVCIQDNIVDELNRNLIHDWVSLLEKGTVDIVAVLHLFSAARHLERIADHATNIAQDVIYLVDGEIARHWNESYVTAE